MTPVYTDTINSQVTGTITQVLYREGQLVHKGEPLIQIDPRPYQANVLRPRERWSGTPTCWRRPQMDLKRYQAAWARNAIPKQTLDDQEKLVLQDQGTVKADQGTLQYDQMQLAFCHITAPIDGRVGLRLVDPGNLVRQQHHAAGGGHPDAADHRGLHHPGRQRDATATANAPGQAAAGRCL